MTTREFWKVCKKLANEERLDVLRHVILSPADEGITVGQIADVVRLGQPATSIYLAQLQNDCGLVSSFREGRYSLYRAKPDSSDERLAMLSAALWKYFAGESVGFVFINGRRPSPPPFLAILPALANKDRVKVLRAVRDGKCTNKASVMAATGMTELNVRRHLECLFECGLAEGGFSGFSWKEPTDSLSKLFISLSLA